MGGAEDWKDTGGKSMGVRCVFLDLIPTIQAKSLTLEDLGI